MKIQSETTLPTNAQCKTPRRSDLTAKEDSRSKNCRKEQSADQQKTLAEQSAKNTRSDQPSNLIPHDKDHAGDP
jgi:hypothetical protein